MGLLAGRTFRLIYFIIMFLRACSLSKTVLLFFREKLDPSVVEDPSTIGEKSFYYQKLLSPLFSGLKYSFIISFLLPHFSRFTALGCLYLVHDSLSEAEAEVYDFEVRSNPIKITSPFLPFPLQPVIESEDGLLRN